MGDNLRKASPGTPLRIPAQTWNGLMEMLEDFRRQRGVGTGGSGPQRSNDIVLVRNDSDGDIPRFGILGIDSVIFEPTSESATQTFKNQITFTGVPPEVGKHDGQFIIAQEPATPGRIFRGLVAGVSVVLVKMENADDLFADIDDGETAHLKSGGTGVAQILWREEPEGDGDVVWAIVRFGGAPGSIDAKLLSSNGDGSYQAIEIEPIVPEDADESTPPEWTVKENAEEFTAWEQNFAVAMPVNEVAEDEQDTPVIVECRKRGPVWVFAMPVPRVITEYKILQMHAENGEPQILFDYARAFLETSEEESG